MADQIISKKCSKCKQIKVASQNPEKSEFFKHRIRKDGYRNECKLCTLKTNKKYRHTKEGKKAIKRYAQSEKGKAARKRHWKTEKYKMTHHKAILNYRKTEKGKVYKKTTNENYKIRHPERVKAHEAVNNAINAGQLPRPDTLPCHYCPAQAKEYHHWHGYEPEYWLDVVPVCKKCHVKTRLVK